MTDKKDTETKIEQPMGNEEKVVTTEDTEESERILYRKYDSEDMMKIRSHGIKVSVDESGREKSITDMGGLQKSSIVCGIKKAPFFSDNIEERKGVTDEIFNRRYYQEFRKIPVNILDKVFKEVSAHNRADFNAQELQKN